MKIASEAKSEERVTMKRIEGMVQCTDHMCPIRVHWHVKANYKEYWRVKITVTNFNYRMNYTQWTLVAQHPNFNNLSNVYKFLYKPLTQYQSTSETVIVFIINTNPQSYNFS